MKLFLPSSLLPEPLWRLAVALPLTFCSLALFAGCVSRSPATVIPASLRTSAAASTAPRQAILIHVHSLPLYQQAELACKQKRFAEAAALLQRLGAQKGLDIAEITFLQQQRVICLHDAGLPVPSSTAARSTAPALPFLTSVSLPAAAANSLLDADCGPRALLLLCNRLGVKTTLHFLRQQAGTTTAGTSLAGVAMAAKAVGLKAEGVQVSREALSEIRSDALAYINSNHFILVSALQGSGENATATVHDPNRAGEETMSQERLLRLCSGYLLLVKR